MDKRKKRIIKTIFHFISGLLLILLFFGVLNYLFIYGKRLQGNDRVDYFFVLLLFMYFGGSFLISMLLGLMVNIVSKTDKIIELCFYLVVFALNTYFFLAYNPGTTSIDFPVYFAEFFFGFIFGNLFLMMRRIKKNEKHWD